MSLMKKCKGCPQKNLVNDFPLIKSRGKEYRSSFCSECMRNKQKSYRDKNKEKIKQRNSSYYEGIKSTPEYLEKSKQYRDANKASKQDYDKEYRLCHKEEYKQYCLDNIDKITNIRRFYHAEHKEERKAYNQQWYVDNKGKKHKINTKYILKRLKRDMSFRLRHNVSRAIRKSLKTNGSTKNGASILNFLPYTALELKEYLENKFEFWMTWENYGSYSVVIWDDNIPATWTWQIDHIVPQSDLPYRSMTDDNFKKCWALDNLRPLSSKQNLLDGITKIRHKEVKK